MEPFVLTPEQGEAVKRMTAEPTRACLNSSGLGTGKTLMAVELAKALGSQTVLVVAPLNTHVNWELTFQRQQVNLPVYTIKSENDHFNLLKAKVPGVYLIGREMYYLGATSSEVREDGTRARTAKYDWKKTKPDLHIVDESHSATNRWGLMAKTLNTHPSGYRLAMSGTPQGSKFDGYWSVCRWLWPDRIDRSKRRWEAVWCSTERQVVGREPTGELKWVTKITGEKRPGKFIKSLPCVIQLKAKKVPYELFEGRVDLTPEQRVMWDEMARKSIAWLGDNPTVAKLPVEKRIRLRQMALAVPEVNDETGEVSFASDAPSPKIDAALKIQARHPGEKILFLTDSEKFARIAAPRLGAALFTGRVPKKKRREILDSFGTKDGAQYLVATYQAIAEGTDGMQNHCHVEVLFNAVDSSVLSEQAEGRLNRTGQKAEKVVRYTLVARNTADDDHLEALEAKVTLRRKEIEL